MNELVNDVSRNIYCVVIAYIDFQSGNGLSTKLHQFSTRLLPLIHHLIFWSILQVVFLAEQFVLLPVNSFTSTALELPQGQELLVQLLEKSGITFLTRYDPATHSPFLRRT